MSDLDRCDRCGTTEPGDRFDGDDWQSASVCAGCLTPREQAAHGVPFDDEPTMPDPLS